jgi:tRNA threonylcarbamoyladenosine biosynthesis protein TsaE
MDNFSFTGDVVPILREGELDIISYNAEQTQRLGARLGTLLQPGDILCLSGDMGAGKTVFSAGIGKGWGALTPLTSPTFNIVHEHRRSRDQQRLYHMDCYRLQNPDDAEGVGLEEILSGRGAVIIEWPEKIESVLPRQRLWVELRILEPTRRNFIFEAEGKRYKELLETFRGVSFGV